MHSQDKPKKMDLRFFDDLPFDFQSSVFALLTREELLNLALTSKASMQSVNHPTYFLGVLKRIAICHFMADPKKLTDLTYMQLLQKYSDYLLLALKGFLEHPAYK